jgi:hypothetical protein
MEDVYQTADWKNKVLPGWIVGTAGAVPYRIPSEAGPAQKAQTDVHGYMIGTVSADGSVSFEFQKLSLEDLITAGHGTFSEPLIRWCYPRTNSRVSSSLNAPAAAPSCWTCFPS